jgi:hypothetical protein
MQSDFGFDAKSGNQLQSTQVVQSCCALAVFVCNDLETSDVCFL